ncbi:MAG: hypothetical protein ACREQ8_17955 [Woeseiaceae bacterium]
MHDFVSIRQGERKFRPEDSVALHEASRLDGLIEQFQPTLWIHGHTHEPSDYELFRTRVVCNPRGYPGEHGHVGFRPDLTVLV